MAVETQNKDGGLPMGPAEQRGDLKQFRTFESDAAEAVSEGQLTASEIVLAEQKRNAELEKEDPAAMPEAPKIKKDKRNLLLISSTILLGSGLVILAAYFIFFRPETPVPGPVFAGKPILSINSEIVIDVTGKRQTQVVSLIENALRQNVTVGSIVNLKLAESVPAPDGSFYSAPLATESALPLISPSIPVTLVRSLGGSFALAILGYDGNHPLLILKTKEYENAYAGMLKWEKDLYRDLSWLFIKTDLNSLIGTSSVSVQESYFGTDPRSQLWNDTVIKSINTRTVKDVKDTVVFVYAFADRETIVMTDNEKAFSEIVERLRRSRLILE